MSVLGDLKRLSAAEDFFAALDVDYEPAVVNVARLHILRRMGQYLRETDLDGQPEEAVREACRATLLRAYDDFKRSSPIEERVFKVHQDAIKPRQAAPAPFVPLAALTGEKV
jgi:nitrogenase-stabilizing/protective protein